MLNSKINNVKIKGIITVVPKTNISLLDIEDLYEGDSDKIDRVINSSGFLNRRIASKDTTSADLCFYAAEKLIEGMQIEKNSVDGVIFVSTSPDYFMPPSSCVIHERLGLKDDCAVFDINHACTGFMYGLWVGASLLNSGLKRILLLCGDTFNKYNDMFKNNSAPIFGDGGSAALLEYDETATPVYFSIGSQTSGYKSIFCENGAFKNPPSLNDFYQNGNYKYNSSMDGMKVFKFTSEKVPACLSDVLKFSNTNINEIDYCIMHQANKFILKNIAKYIGLSEQKMPMNTLTKYGNLVSASIPAVICDAKLSGEHKLLLCGFGVGLTYMSCVIDVKNIYCEDVIDMEEV